MIKYLFVPKPEITAFELAHIWANCRLEVDETLYNSLNDAMQNHFIKSPSIEDVK